VDTGARSRGTHGAGPAARAGTTWWSPRAVGLHVTLVIVLPVFAGLFWWQVQRVREGNTLSWAYVFEWPFFAGYAVYLWWRLVHEQPEPAGARTSPAAAAPGAGPDAGAGAPEGAGATVEAAGAGPGAAGAAGAGGGDGQAAENEDEELAAYNRYLAELDASGRRKHW
jgi:hypothetical protein